MNRHTYPGGYEEYLTTQKATTARKRRRQWASEEDISYIARILVRRGYSTISGLCHGTRSGQEQRWMMKHLRAEGSETGSVIGSELAPGKFDPLTFEHDFNTVREEWLGRFSFIYSNSFDHSFDPEVTLKTWGDQLHPKGVIVLEHTRMHVKPSKTDPTGGKIADYEALFKKTDFHHLDTLMFRPAGAPTMKRYFFIKPNAYHER